MSNDSHREVRNLLGAYALGMLDDGSRAFVDSHLDGCADCRAEVEFIEPAAAALPLADPDRVAAQPAPPPELGERILAAARDEPSPRKRWLRERGTRYTLIASAVALVLGIGVGAAAGYTAFAPDPVPLESVATDVHDERVDADAELIPHTWGVEIRLTGSGFEEGETYRATLFDDEGNLYPAGEFVGVGAEPMVCNLNSSLLRDDAVGFEITDDGGSTVMTSSF